MRKLSYVFMVLSTLCFAAPAFAQGGASNSGRSGGFGTQSRGPLRYSIRADSWFGADRITGAVHPGNYFCQGKVDLVVRI